MSKIYLHTDQPKKLATKDYKKMLRFVQKSLNQAGVNKTFLKGEYAGYSWQRGINNVLVNKQHFKNSNSASIGITVGPPQYMGL